MAYFNGKQIFFSPAVAIANTKPDETIEYTINPPNWLYMCVASDDIYKPEVGKQYFVTLKNTDGTALDAPVFKLMTAINTPQGAFPTTYTLVGDGTYETGNGILKENNVVELVDWNDGNPIFRFGGVNAISIETQKPYKKMKFYYNGTVTGATVNGTYFLIRLRDDVNDYYNLNADVPFSLTLQHSVANPVAIQAEIYKINDVYQVSATTVVGTKYSTSNATKVSFVNNNSDVKPCNVMFNTNKATGSAGMIFANGSKIICEVWYE